MNVVVVIALWPRQCGGGGTKIVIASGVAREIK